MNSDLRVIKGVNIAVIILSGLGLLGAIITAIASAVGHGYLYSPEFQSLLYSLFEEEMSSSSSGMSYDDAVNITTLISSVTIVMFVVISILGIVVKGVLIAAGYFGLKTAEDPSRAKTSFIWAIVGAILAGLCGSFVSMILFIVSAVYLNKLRRADGPSAFTGSTAPYYSVPYQQVPYQPTYTAAPVPPQTPGVPVQPQPVVSQPMPVQPVQPTQPAPSQPVAAQPVAPQQPAQPMPAQPTEPQPPQEPQEPATEPEQSATDNSSEDEQRPRQ